MKIASIFAAMPGNHNGLLEVKKAVSETLTELGIEPEEINLGYRSLPYFDGIKSDYMHTIAEMINQVDGIILYVSASFGLPGALIQTLLEHFGYGEYSGIMNNKNCFVVMDCDDGSGASAMASLDMALYNMGAFTGARLIMDSNFAEKFEPESKNHVLVGRLCEDFYRALRQQRVIYRPSATANASAPAPKAEVRNTAVYEEKSNVVQLNNYAEPENYAKQASSPNALDSLNINEFSESQQKDIAEISRFFAEKFKQEANHEPSFSHEPLVNIEPKNAKPTLAQKTSSLTHYYKAGQADGLKATVSLSISGKDGFDGYIEMNNADCDFNMGQPKVADVTIIAEDNKWSDIIKGKISAQKAFMIGQIKVRGNFVLLSKFDQLFDFDRNID